jgi:ATP-dependent helicase HrpB
LTTPGGSDWTAFDLPVAAVLGTLSQALLTDVRPCPGAVLAAPPGAGKTTLVPLHLLDAPWRGDGRIILVEPRRLAARAAARRMAAMLGEEVGQTVGYRMRLDSRISRKTRVEVITEGVFVRMVLDDPELAGVAAVIFDEFHERALDADFGLALALDVRAGLREDLRILVMSATLDTGRVAALLGAAPVVASSGRVFPVEIRHVDRPGTQRIEDAVALAIRSALADEEGSVLAFLPGQAEIRRTIERLDGRLPADVKIAPLYGAMDGPAQDLAIRPVGPGRRKVVLATAIAETSITIDGVRIVIDSGLSRQPVFEPATGITRLETMRVSRAAADQRAGRAGRTQPGIAIRLWRAEQTAALAAFAPPEILSSDLTSLLLDCAAWGVEPGALAFIDPPPPAALAEARALLETLGAFDRSGHLTPAGRQMRGLALPARLAAMVVGANGVNGRRMAAELALLITERGLGGDGVDLAERLRRFRGDRSPHAERARALASNMARAVSQERSDAASADPVPSPAALLLPGFPDRLAASRGQRGRYLLANGRGGELPENDMLAGARFLVVADLTGRAGAQRILIAAALDEDEIDAVLAARAETVELCRFDRASRSVRARRIRRIGAITLDEAALPRPPADEMAAALAEGVRLLGIDALPWTKETAQLRDRLGFLHRSLGSPWPDVSDAALLNTLDIWFEPFQQDVADFDSIRPAGLRDGLMALVPYDLHRQLDTLAPTHITVPTGSRIPVRYDGDEPVLSVRVQELFGLTRHPSLADGRWPLLLELLSPAQRPLQLTRDLPGFWAGSWSDVRAEMRGRYPRHPWPEDPAAAEATRRVKPRGD